MGHNFTLMAPKSHDPSHLCPLSFHTDSGIVFITYFIPLNIRICDVGCGVINTWMGLSLVPLLTAPTSYIYISEVIWDRTVPGQPDS